MLFRSNAKGLNIITQAATIGPFPEYIRFYAGTDVQAANGQPHIHIDGDGSNQGYIGIGQGNTNPTSMVDISGATGNSQLRLRTAYAPTSSADGNGNVGDICWGLDGATFYLYVRTNVGWRRGTLTGPWV